MSTPYIQLMTTHWKHTLTLASSEPLKHGWRQFETACDRALAGSQVWQVLQLPTGSGKTEALKTFCAYHTAEQHDGILVVTRFIAAADDLAAGINQQAGREVAIASHSASSLTAAAIADAQILIITHSAYKSALSEAASNGISPQLDRYMLYGQADRKLVVIDEAFEWVESFRVDLSELSACCGALGGIPKLNANEALAELEAFADSAIKEANTRSSDELFSTELSAKLASLDLVELGAILSQLSNSELAIWDAIDMPKNAVRRVYLSLLDDLQRFQEINWGWLSNRGNHCQLNGSRLLMEVARAPGIILDATADIDKNYDLLGQRVDLLPRPPGIRNYRNVVLNVSAGHRVGKHHLTNHAKEVWSLLIPALNKHFDEGSQALIISHKDVEANLSVRGLKGSVANTAHWGALDGKNEWRDCNVGVLFGLPFLDDIVPTNAVLACQPCLRATWFDGRRQFGKHQDIGKEFKIGFVAKSVVQAINRIRCRRSVDAAGNCPTTDLFMLLGKGRTAGAVVDAIKSQMPGIGVLEWDTGWSTSPNKLGRTEEKLLTFLSEMPTGKVAKSAVIAGLGIAARTFERLSTKLQQTSSKLQEALTSVGVQYHCAIGRGKEAYFMKS